MSINNTIEWVAIMNPVSGGAKGAAECKLVLTELDKAGIKYAAHSTKHQKNGIELAKAAIEGGARHIIGIGGDGTVNEMVNGILSQTTVPSSEVTLAIIPIGTGNDTVKTLKIPTDKRAAVSLISKGNTRLIDAGEVLSTYPEGVQNRFFVNIAGLGFDASVVEVANQGKASSGKWTYLKALLTSLSGYEPTQVTVTFDDNNTITDSMYSINIANCKYSGGGMLFGPKADPSDGLLDTALFRNFTKWGLIFNIGKLYSGTIDKLEKVNIIKAKKIVIDSDTPIYVEVEGELLGQTPVVVRVVPASLKVIVP